MRENHCLPSVTHPLSEYAFLMKVGIMPKTDVEGRLHNRVVWSEGKEIKKRFVTKYEKKTFNGQFL